MFASLLSPRVADENIRQFIAQRLGFVKVSSLYLNSDVGALVSIVKELMEFLRLFPRWAWEGINVSIVHDNPMSLQKYLEYIRQMSGYIDTMSDLTPKQVKALLQAFITVLRQIASMLDKVSDLLDDGTNQREIDNLMQMIKEEENLGTLDDLHTKVLEFPSMDSILDYIFFKCTIEVQVEECGVPAFPLSHCVSCAFEALSRIGISHYTHQDRRTISAMMSQLTSGDLQQIISILIGTDTAFTGVVRQDDVEQLLMLLNEMLHLHQAMYVSGTLSLHPLPFLAVLKEMSKCPDESRLQQLLLYIRHHMDRGMGVLEGEPTTAFYVPDVNPEDDADVLAPREPMHQSLREYADALLAVMHKIMAPSA
jgi:hypothetical protein